jgi:ferredoxin
MKPLWVGYNKTRFVWVNSKTCNACWKCIEICKHGVLGKVDFFFHKHAQIEYPDKCTGCLKCVRECSTLAITHIPKKRRDNCMGKKSNSPSFNKRAFVSVGMIVTTVILPISGFLCHLLQFQTLTLKQHFYMAVHNTAGMLFIIFTTTHIIMNRRALKNYLSQNSPYIFSKESLFAAMLVVGIISLIASHAFLVNEIFRHGIIH